MYILLLFGKLYCKLIVLAFGLRSGFLVRQSGILFLPALYRRGPIAGRCSFEMTGERGVSVKSHSKFDTQNRSPVYSWCFAERARRPPGVAQHFMDMVWRLDRFFISSRRSLSVSFMVQEPFFFFLNALLRTSVGSIQFP